MFAEPENGRSIAEAITFLADSPAMREEMGINGRKWVLENATRQVLADRYLDVMAELIV